MKIYYYDQNNGEFLGESKAVKDPGEEALGNEKWLLPAGATFDKPGHTGEDEVAIWDGSEWIITPDFRGQTVYKKSDGSPMIFTEIGAIDSDYVLTAPEIDFPTWDEGASAWIENTQAKNAARIVEIHAELLAIDMASIRPSRAINKTGNGVAADQEKLDQLEAQAEVLRIELAGLS
jgi:hypothetical protein